jgi:class 3 adenylate cyclase
MDIKSLSLKSKLVVMFLLIALSCILIVGYQGIQHGKEALTERVYSQLTNIRETKRDQLEDYYADTQGMISSLANNYTTKYAMREFTDAFRRIQDEPPELTESQQQGLEDFYSNEYFPRLTKSINDKPQLKHYLPISPVGQYLQSQYLSANKYAVGEKQSLNEGADKTYYNSLHRHYHPIFKDFIENNGFFDLFLIDIESGDVVYSVSKETDYATNLGHGIYRTSGLADIYNVVVDAQNAGEVLGGDFDFYKPSYGAPAMFMGTTIFDVDQRPIGVLALQVLVDEINSVMTGNKGWKNQGLGETGETYLVGADHLMRSGSRLLHADKDNASCYTHALVERALMDKQTARRICQLKTSILLQPVENRAVNAALKGGSGTQVVESYSGKQSLVAYAPLILGTMRWAIVAQIDLDEANAPVVEFQKELGVSAVILASLVTFLAMSLAYFFTQPFTGLVNSVRHLSLGKTDVDPKLLNRHDEFGDLAKNLVVTADLIARQQQIISDQELQRKLVLLDRYPEKVVRFLEHGNEFYAEAIDNVSVLYTTLGGFADYATKLDTKEAITILNQLIEGFDQIAAKHEIEKIKTIGDSYLAACGVNVSRLDHAKRCVDVGFEMLRQIERFNLLHGTHFILRIGVHSGSVTAGIIGNKRKSYDLWGKTLQIAGRMRFEADRSALLISEETYHRLPDKSLFQTQHTVKTQAMGDF